MVLKSIKWGLRHKTLLYLEFWFIGLLTFRLMCGYFLGYGLTTTFLWGSFFLMLLSYPIYLGIIWLISKGVQRYAKI